MTQRQIVLLAVGSLAVLAPFVSRTCGQAAPGASGRGFRASEKDAQGRRVSIRGEAYRGLASGRMAFTGMQIEISRGTNAAMTIEALDGIYDPKSETAVSTNALTLRTSDERLSLTGMGFRYQWTDSRLIVSNAVRTIIRRKLSGTPEEKPAPVSRSVAATNTSDRVLGTNTPPAQAEPIEILSDQLDFVSDLATFNGHVRAKDDQGNLSCGILKAFFEAGGNSVRKIEADHNVVFERGDRRTTSDRAVYLLAEDIVTLTGKPAWKLGENEGSSEILRLNNKTREFEAERGVQVKLPPRNMLPLDWLGDTSRTNSPGQTNQSLTIYSEKLNYNPTNAVFQGGVRILEPQGGELRCGVMTNFFSGQDNKMSAVVLRENVEFKRGAAWMRSDQASYQTNSDFVTLTGSPMWKTKQGEGRGETVFIHPKTKQIHAERNVTMKLLGSGLEALDLSLQKGRTNSLGRTNQEFVINSGEVYYHSGSAIFLRGVRVTALDQPEHDLTCEVLAAFFLEPENKLDELVAEENVRIRQGDIRATGEKVVYLVPKGLLDVSGGPVITSPGRKYIGDRFLLNRIDNSFRIIGNYKIELDRNTIATASEKNP